MVNHNKATNTETDTVVSDIDSTQASKRTMNFRVLTISMVIAAIVGAILVSIFWVQTPDETAMHDTGTTAQSVLSVA